MVVPTLFSTAPSPMTQDTSQRFRAGTRDSLFMAARIELPDGNSFEATIRNISSGGMRVKCGVIPHKGSFLEAVLPNVGRVRARVSWTSTDSFGLSFIDEVDPVVVR